MSNSARQLPKIFINRKHHLQLVAFSFSLFIILFTSSVFLYPEPVSITEHWISDLGNPLKNYDGFFFFNLSVFLSGILLIFHYYFLTNSIEFRFKNSKYVFSIIGYAGSMGFLLIGIFTDNIQPYHDICAGITFFGLGLAGFGISFSQFLVTIKEKPKKLIKIILLISAMVSLIIFVLAFSIFAIPNAQQYSDFIPWEWACFILLMYNIIVNAVLIPD